ncbi:MAG: response regulator [Thaumarchaeota archaeon]|nr:MAG: response regulator [Nitrososphaerota archaeon]
MFLQHYKSRLSTSFLMANEVAKLDLACTYMKNNQTISAYNLFMTLAENEMKKKDYRAGILLLLASECKAKQGKVRHNELLQAAKFYLEVAKKEKPNISKYSYLCAAKCFLRIGQYNDAMAAFEQAKRYIPTVVEEKKPIVVIDDSPSITLKLNSYLKKLGYKDIHTFGDGSSAIESIKKLIQSLQNPIVLLDMELPDMSGDVIAKTLLKLKPDLSIILITADEKTTPRVKSTIGWGSTAFVQKPFTINELKNALDVTESGSLT